MADRKRFLLRIDPRVHAALEKWAADDLRSVNAQIEFLLKEALQRAGRWRTEPVPRETEADREAASAPDASGEAETDA